MKGLCPATNHDESSFEIECASTRVSFLGEDSLRFWQWFIVLNLIGWSQFSRNDEGHSSLFSGSSTRRYLFALKQQRQERPQSKLDGYNGSRRARLLMRRSRVLTFSFPPVFFSSPIFFVFFVSSPSPSLSWLSFSRRSLNHSDPHRSVLVLCKYLKYYNVDSFYFFLLFLLAMPTYRFYLLFRREMFTNIVNFSSAVIWTDFFSIFSCSFL